MWFIKNLDKKAIIPPQNVLEGNVSTVDFITPHTLKELVDFLEGKTDEGNVQIVYLPEEQETEMADIDMYEDFKGYDPAPQKPFDLPSYKVFSPFMFLSGVRAKRTLCPFSREWYEKNGKIDRFDSEAFDLKLEKAFGSLFDN